MVIKLAFFIFLANFLILLQLGAKHVESPFIELGQISTAIYFSHLLIIVPLITLLENSLIDLALSNNIPSKWEVRMSTKSRQLFPKLFNYYEAANQKSMTKILKEVYEWLDELKKSEFRKDSDKGKKVTPFNLRYK